MPDYLIFSRGWHFWRVDFQSYFLFGHQMPCRQFPVDIEEGPLIFDFRVPKCVESVFCRSTGFWFNVFSGEHDQNVFKFGGCISYFVSEGFWSLAKFLFVFVASISKFLFGKHFSCYFENFLNLDYLVRLARRCCPACLGIVNLLALCACFYSFPLYPVEKIWRSGNSIYLWEDNSLFNKWRKYLDLKEQLWVWRDEMWQSLRKRKGGIGEFFSADR